MSSRQLKFRLRYHTELYLLLAPYVLGAGLLVAVPALLSFGLAFFSYDGLSAPVWVGLQNLQALRLDPLLPTAFYNSLFFVGLAVPLRLLGALGLSLWFNRPRRGVGFYRAAIYLPTIIPDVAYALAWLWIFNPLYGPLNQGLALLGLPTPAWLTDPLAARFALVLVAIFPIGEGFVILLAGLKNISPDLYDAARVDGGGRWQLFRHITWPLLTPWLLLLAFRDVILSFQSTFTPAVIMTGGGPYYATLYLPLLIFEEAFDRLRFGTGSAMTVVLCAVTVVLLYWLYNMFAGWGYDE